MIHFPAVVCTRSPDTMITPSRSGVWVEVVLQDRVRLLSDTPQHGSARHPSEGNGAIGTLKSRQPFVIVNVYVRLPGAFPQIAPQLLTRVPERVDAAQEYSLWLGARVPSRHITPSELSIVMLH